MFTHQHIVQCTRQKECPQCTHLRKVCHTPSACELHVDSIPATVKSWSVPYQGNSARALYEYMQFHGNPDLYARILAIVQSSGMGKSRMIDQLSKYHFVIPLNLRDGESGRFSIRLISKSGLTPGDRLSPFRFPGARLV
jgi:hypothetical protein